MSNKSISINPNPRNKPQSAAGTLDAFVHGEAPPSSVTKEPMKRFTFDIPKDLHKRIKRACLEKDVNMAVELRHILHEHFPAESVK
jgi:hypothetical protein